MSKTTDKSTTEPRRRDPEATRAAILDAAEALFIDQGVAATPTSAIARRAKVTKSLIHHHFGTKEALWTEVKERHFRKYYDVQKQMLASSKGTAQLLRDSIIAYFRFLQQDPDAVRFTSWRFVETDDPCLQEEQELYDMGVQRIREAQEAGELRADLEPIFILKAFLGLAMHWFQSKSVFCQLLGETADPDTLDEDYLQNILELFFAGVTPR